MITEVTPLPGGSNSPETNDQRLLAIALTIALVIAPFCLGLRIDWDRTLPLLLLPALCLMWKSPTRWQSAEDSLISTRSNFIETQFILAAAFFCTASAIFAAHPARALATSAGWVLIIAGGIAATRLANNPKAIRLILTGIALGGVISLAIVRLRISPEIGVPLFGHPRLLGLYMLIALICALGLAFTASSEQKKYATGAYAVAAILCGGMIWSGGRTPFVGFAAGIVLWLTILPKSQRLALFSRVFAIVGAGLIISILLGHPISGLGWDFAFGRTANAGSMAELSSNRTDIWAVSLREFINHPWLGHGADFYLFQIPRVSGASGSHPHNFLVQWLVEFGLFGTIPLLCLLGSRLFHGLSKAATPLNQIAVVGLMTCTISALLDGGFYHAVIFMPAAVLAGLCYSLAKQPLFVIKPPVSGKIFRALGLGVIAISTVILTLNGWLFYQLKYSVPVSPQAATAIALRYFPSNLHGLWTWMDTWKATNPQSAIEWGTWAQNEAVQPELFAIYTANQYLERQDFVAAEAELQKTLIYLVPEQQKPIRGMVNEVRRQAALSAKTKIAN